MPGKSLFSARHDKLLELLRSMRTNAGLSQLQAAKSLKRPQSFISKCESGERRVDVIEFIDFCKVYGVKPEATLAQLGQMPRREAKLRNEAEAGRQGRSEVK